MVAPMLVGIGAIFLYFAPYNLLCDELCTKKSGVHAPDFFVHKYRLRMTTSSP